MSGAVIWFEVMGQDADKVKHFYSELLGWQLELEGPMQYAMVDKQEGGIPGGVGVSSEGPGWTTFYVQVDDIEESMARAESLGGRVLLPIREIPGGDRIAVFADPEGHPIGLVQTT